MWLLWEKIQQQKIKRLEISSEHQFIFILIWTDKQILFKNNIHHAKDHMDMNLVFFVVVVVDDDDDDALFIEESSTCISVNTISFEYDTLVFPPDLLVFHPHI